MMDMTTQPGTDPNETPAAPTDAEQKPIGPYQMADEDLVKTIRKWLKEAAEGRAEIQKKRRNEWKQLAGDQWEETDAKLMDKQKRPRLTLNLLLTIMAAVEGEERTNRQEIKTFGEGQEDDPAAHGLNRLIKWVMNQCGGEFALSDFFRSGAAVGEGWIGPEIDFFEDPEGKISLVFVDDDECYPDPLDVTATASKGRYFHRARMFEEDEIEARWPGKLGSLTTAAELATAVNETDGRGYRDIYLTPNDPKSPKIYNATTKQWCIVETWWPQIEPGWVIVNEANGLLEEKSEDEFAEMKAQRANEQRAHIQALMAGQPPMMQGPPDALGQPTVQPKPIPKAIQATQRQVRCLYQAFTCNEVLLEKRKSPVKGMKRQPYVAFRALFDKVKKEWFGVLRPLLDPQKQHNVEQSAIVQWTQQMPKNAWMAPKGGFVNRQEWQEKIAQPGAMLEYNPQKGKPEPVQPPAIPRHMIDMAFSRPAMMREISGVNTEMTGQRVGSDAGVVMEMRRKAATTVLAPIFDNYRRAKIEVGKILLAYIQTYIKPGRKIRVLGEDENRYVEMTEQMGLLRYDIAVDESNSTVNDRIATLNVLQTTLPQLAKTGVAITPGFVDLLPMPPHVRQEWKRQIAWDLTISGRLPPAGWQPGMPVPAPALPAPPQGAEPHPAPPPAA
jgi:hypothetical protein